MRCLRYILYALIIILILLIVFIMLFVTTNTGLRAGLSLAEHFIPGNVSYESINGRLIGPLTITNLNYENDEMKVKISNIAIKGSLLPVLVRNLQLSSLTIEGINYYALKTPEKKTAEKSGSFSFNGLPIQLNIKQANISDVLIHHGKNLTQINQITFGVSTRHQRVTITKLNINTPNYEVNVSGNLLTGMPFTTALSAQISGHFNQEQLTDLHLGISGDVKKMMIAAQSREPFFSTANIELLNLNKNPSINGQASWQNMIWIIDGVSSLQMQKGEFTIQGPLSHYQFSLSTDISGSKIPTGSWQLNGAGTDKSMNINTINANTLGGTLVANGEVTWSPTLSWKINVAGQHINPGEKWKHWQANINFSGQSIGNVNQDQSMDARAVISQLNGTLHQYELDGQADVELNDKHLTIHALHAKLGNNQLSASGHLNKNWHMQWEANLPDLQDIWETGGGSVNTEGTIAGDRVHPQISATAHGAHINLPWFSLDNLQATATIGASSTSPANVQMEIDNLHYHGHVVNQIKITSQGTINKQTIVSEYTTPALSIYAQFDGGMQDNLWQGLLSKLEVNTQYFSNWQLKSPSMLKMNATQASIGNSCLISTNRSICLQADWLAKEKISANLISSNLNLNILNPMLSKNISIDAPIEFALNFDSEKNNKQSGTANIAIPSGQLKYTYQDTTQILNIKPSMLIAHLTPKGLDATINAAADPQQTITGDIKLPGLQLIDGIRQNQQFSADLKLDAPDLSWLASVISPLENTKGSLEGSLTANGNFTEPLVNGKIVLKNGAFDVPALGLSPHDVNFTAEFKPKQQLVYEGNFISGEGKLGIRGHTVLNSFLNTQLEIKGYNVAGIDNQEYKIFFSPDLHIQFDRPKLTITGSLNIPNATITPKTFEGTTTLPDNIVYIEPRTKNTPPLQTYLNINLSLKNVDFAYQGLKAQVEGELNIQDSPDTVMSATGSLNTVNGRYKAYNQNLTIQKGKLFYNGGPIENPGIDIVAVREIQTVFDGSGIQQTLTVGLNITGTMKRPKLSLFSQPITLSQANILSYIIFGHGTGTANGGEGQILLAAASSIGLDDNALTKNIQNTFGLSELGFENDEVMDQQGNLESNTSLVIGKQITPKLSVKYSAGLLVPVSVVRMIYQLSRHWSVQSDASTYDNGADIFYTIETD